MNEYIRQLINNEISDEEFVISLHFSRFDTNKSMIVELQEEIGKKDSKRFLKLMELEKDFERTLDRTHKNYVDKIYNKKITKLIAKELVKDKSCVVSQTSIMEMLSHIGIDILEKVSIHELKNNYSNELLDLYIETLQSDKYLKQEFHLFINKLIKEFVKKPLIESTEQEQYHIELYTMEHGKYLTYLYQNKLEELDSIKNKIIEVIHYDTKEVKNIVNKIKQDDEDLKESINNHRKEILEEEIQKLAEKLKEENSDLTDQYNDDAFNETAKSILNNEYLNPELRLYNDKFDKYFNYDHQQDFMEYCDIITYVYDPDNQSEYKIQNYLWHYLMDTSDKYIEENECDEETKDMLHVIMGAYFMELLAYHIHSSNTLDHKTKKEMINEFINILVNNEACKENYNDETKSNIVVHALHKYLPIDHYYNHIISSVLYEIDDKKVSKEVLRILNKYFGKVNKNDLIKKCKEQTESYTSISNFELIMEDQIHEFAIYFIYYYLKDKVFMASFSPFTRYTQDVILEHFKLEYYNSEELYTILVNDENKLSSDEILSTTKQAYELFNEIMDKVNHSDEQILCDSVMNTLLFIQSRDYDINHFLNIDNFNELANKHKPLLVEQIEYYLRKDEVFKFKEASIENQIQLLWQLSIDIELMKEIEKTSDLLPTLEDLEKKNKAKLLEKENHSLKHEIKELNKEIKTYEKEIHKVKSNTKDIIHKEINNISNVYNNEINSLNKKINELENIINSFNEDKNELNKLREYFFSLNNEEVEIIEEQVDLSECIKDKSIVIVGGLIHLVKKLKEKYPGLKVVRQESHITNELFKNVDYIFIFSDYISHGLYYKAMKYIHKYNLKWDYMNGVNVEKVEKDMYLKLMK